MNNSFIERAVPEGLPRGSRGPQAPVPPPPSSSLRAGLRPGRNGSQRNSTLEKHLPVRALHVRAKFARNWNNKTGDVVDDSVKPWTKALHQGPNVVTVPVCCLSITRRVRHWRSTRNCEGKPASQGLACCVRAATVRLPCALCFAWSGLASYTPQSPSHTA